MHTGGRDEERAAGRGGSREHLKAQQYGRGPSVLGGQPGGLKLDRRHRANIAVDAGVGRGTNGAWVGLNEAFPAVARVTLTSRYLVWETRVGL